jgi:effector-binding domain-containing protein
MDIEIFAKNFKLDIYGFGGIATTNNHTGTAFKLSGKMWDVIKSKGIKNKGKNIWVYETANKVFAGVELENPTTDGDNFGLEKMTIDQKKCAYYKHIGSYNLIKQIGQSMKNELTKQGFEIVLPYIEIYGHWTKDESKLETELIMCLK